MFYPRGSLLRKIKMGLINAEGEGGGSGNNDEGDGGDGGEVWYKDMPEAMHEWDEVKGSDTAEKFYDQVANMRKFLGQSVRIPGEDAGKEDWAKFNDKIMTKVPTLMQKPNLEDKEALSQLYGSLGRPEESGGYKVPEIEGADMTAAENFRTVAHDQGLSQAQFNGIVNSVTAANQAANEAAVTANEEAHAGLKTEWGNDYNRRMDMAYTISKLTDAPKDLQEMFKTGRANPESYKWMYNLAQKFKGEGVNLLKDVGHKNIQFTPEEAASKIAEIRGNKEHAYWDKTNPGHKAAMKHMAALYEAKAAKQG